MVSPCLMGEYKVRILGSARNLFSRFGEEGDVVVGLFCPRKHRATSWGGSETKISR